MRFADPLALLLLPVCAAAVAWSFWPRRAGAARFSAVGLAAAVPAGLTRWGPLALAAFRLAGLALLVAVLARPQTSDATEETHSDGIAVQLVIDNSYSMRTRDYSLGGESLSRLDAVKHAVRLFVEGGAPGLSGRPNDKIGIITFARDPDVVCPATLDHAAVLEALDKIALAPPVGTNIGDALAWALDRLQRDPTKQKVVVLLSDGSHNVKDGLQPLEAAQMAADLRVKVYTIGAVGNRFDPSPDLAALLLTARKRTGSEDSVDEPTMRKIADLTGGKYFRATDLDGLAAIYEEIDELEKTQLERTVHVQWREWFFPLAVAAAGLLAVEQLLGATRLLRLP
jgi:Ca-activated chloride channel family protein